MQVNLISGLVVTLNSTSLGIVFALFIITIVYFIFKSKGLPPGPTGLPYFGYWPFLRNDDCHLQLYALKKKYGDVFSFTCTGQLYINLCSHKAVREGFINKSEFFSDRTSSYSLMSRLFKDGIFNMNGESWKSARKFFLVLFKERGSNSLKTSLAGPLYDSIKSTVKDLKTRKGEPLNLVELLTDGCCDFLRFTLFGEEGISKEQLKKFNDLYAKEAMSFLPKTILTSGTFAKYFIFPFIPNFSASLKIHREREKIVQEIINEHKTNYDAENPRDMIDEYFKERDKRRSKGDSTSEFFTDKVLIGSLMQFLGDGALAVASFSSLLMKGLLLYPEEQEKLYKEIVEVIGLDRQPTIEDKSKLTYFNAYVQESMRMQDFFNFFPSQECKKETTIAGYRIPKGAILVPNFYASHFDSEVYEEPKKFNPSRFLSVAGKRKVESPIMFGVGKRSCIGEGYVMTQVFLLLATLIQNFHLSLPEGSKITVESFANSSLLVCAKPRDKN